MTAESAAPLSPAEARRVYNRIGRLQDWQRFYESPAIADLSEHADFGSASAVFELGCGTGALARDLLEHHLAPTATYEGIDVSDTMVRIASRRLAPWVDRSTVTLVSGGLPLPGADHGIDRFIATYVFDLLDVGYARGILDEAHRLLALGGKLGTVSLTAGATPPSRLVGRGWQRVWSRAPGLVGGCRPIDMAALLSDRWDIVHRRVVTAWAISSEVIVATPIPSSDPG